MKKDKEWLEKEINKTLNIDGGSGERIEGFNKGLEFSLDLIEELDEPELPVVPEFVADYLDDFKKQNLTLGDALDTHFEDDKQIHTWLYEDGEVRNDEVFARAWLYGYTIEKEPQWTVKLDKGRYVDNFIESITGVEVEVSHRLGYTAPIRFKDKSKAEAVALLVNGEVVEVTND